MATNRQEQRTQITRERFLDAARELFAARGFDAVSQEELVRHVGLTRGALYHQFGGKEGLFDALYDQMQQEIAARIAAAADALGARAALHAGCRAFLIACADPATQRVVLRDAPRVLGWERWREVDARHGLGTLKEGLRAVVASGDLAPQPVDPLAHLLSGAMNEAAMWIARAPDPDAALREAIAALDGILDGLWIRSEREGQ